MMRPTISRRGRQLVAVMAAAVCALTAAAPAAASTPQFGCRASLARVGLLNSTILEPIVANKAGVPCSTATQGVQPAAIPTVSSFLALAGPAAVYTFDSSSQPTTTGAVAPGAAALTAVDGVTIPTPGGPIVVAGPVAAQAAYACVSGRLTSTSSSTLTVLTIGGKRITLVPDKPLTIPLVGGAYVAVNEKIQTSNSLTERILDVHVPGLADVVVGEAKVSLASSDPCAGTGSQTPPAVNPCPAGSTFDPAHQVCEIVLPGGRVIIISRPYQGPTGGAVLAVSVARKRFRSPCLSGKRPEYVIVGTNKADRINGTRRSERILGLGGRDRIAGQSGSDCIAGGKGNDRIWGGTGHVVHVWGGAGNDRISVQNGNAFAYGGPGRDRIFLGNGTDRAWGGAGNDRIAVGRGNDRVWGGRGNDTLAAGDGNDVVHGGPGKDRIYVGPGRDHIYGDAGSDRLYGRGELMWMNCGKGRDLAYVNIFAARFARRHGCERVRLIKPHKL